MNSTASTVQIFWAASASIFKLRHCVKGWDQGEGSRGQVIDRKITGTGHCSSTRGLWVRGRHLGMGACFHGNFFAIIPKYLSQ